MAWQLCRMFNQSSRGATLPKYLTSDHDPLFRFHQWQANLRILDVIEIKTVPYVPWSHPFIERLIGTIRRECLDQILFWTGEDLEVKLNEFKRYYNQHFPSTIPKFRYRPKPLTPKSFLQGAGRTPTRPASI